jgi:hypothetical protein
VCLINYAGHLHGCVQAGAELNALNADGATAHALSLRQGHHQVRDGKGFLKWAHTRDSEALARALVQNVVLEQARARCYRVFEG